MLLSEYSAFVGAVHFGQNWFGVQVEVFRVGAIGGGAKGRPTKRLEDGTPIVGVEDGGHSSYKWWTS